MYDHLPFWKRLLVSVGHGLGMPVLFYGVLTCGMTLTVNGNHVELYGVYALWSGLALVAAATAAMLVWTRMLTAENLRRLAKEFRALCAELASNFKEAFSGVTSPEFWRFAVLYALPELMTGLAVFASTMALVAALAMAVMNGNVTINDEVVDLLPLATKVGMYGAVSFVITGVLHLLAKRRLRDYNKSA
ncbi:MAG: hypothetical protein GC134_03585 [Proteobacteria bacterium]|nr:hypothetical protein [Pseudomonadota bacterium]